MSGKIHAVTVYCASSRKVHPRYIDAAADLGLAIADAGWQLVYGGNRLGMMQALADAARAHGGRVIGVTPQLLVDEGVADHQCDELIVTEGLRERKALLERRGDAFIAMPGGLGTLEEIFEIIVGRQLGFHDKPIVLLDVDRFYAPLLAMIEHGIEQHFIRRRARDLFHVATSVGEAVDHLR